MATQISKTPVIVFDTETTGLDVANDRVVEFGCAATTSHGVVYGHTQFYLNPGIPIPAEASAIHGITDAKVADAPTFAAKWGDVYRTLSCSLILAGYNAVSYDTPLLNAEFARVGSTYRIDASRVLDPIVFVRWRLRGRRYRKLDEICKHFGVELSNAHSALHDAFATAKLLLEMVRCSFIPDDLDEALTLQARYAALQAEEFEKWSFWLYECRENPGVLRVGAGKHCGKPLSQLDGGFIDWLLGQTDLHAGARAAFTAELDRRAGRAPATPSTPGHGAVPLKLFSEASVSTEQDF